MRRALVLTLFWAGMVGLAHAEWVTLAEGLPEPEIGQLALSAGSEPAIYAASESRLYRWTNEHVWKQLLSVRGGENRIRHILADPRSPETIYVASGKGIQMSSN